MKDPLVRKISMSINKENSGKLQRWFCLFVPVFFTTLLITQSLTAIAGPLTLRMGPPGVGTGGTNPVGIPPSAQDLDISYVTKSGWETSLSVVPGLFLGKRLDFKGPYMSLGGGVALSANGVGPGPYSAFGYDIGSGSFRFNIEYKQALGVTTSGIVAPYALRVGIAWY
jgi:hypothetical protein